MLIICNLQCFPDTYFLISVNEVFFYDLPNFCKKTSLFILGACFFMYIPGLSWCMVGASSGACT